MAPVLIKPRATYFGIWLTGVTGTAGAAPDVFAAAGAAVVVAGTAAPPVTGALATGTAMRSITPPPVGALRLVLKYASARVEAKKIAAATPVDFDMKFDEPVAPNRLPEAPEPKAAPMSAPFPCCSRTRAMMIRADRTCTTTIRLNKVLIAIPFQV